MIRGIIFDYGGTLDTNGTHWFHIFLDRYRHYYPHLTETMCDKHISIPNKPWHTAAR